MKRKRKIVRSTREAYMLAVVKVSRTGNRSRVMVRPVMSLTGVVFILGRLMEKCYGPALGMILLFDLGLAVWELADAATNYVAMMVDFYLVQVEILGTAIIWAIAPKRMGFN